jgi:hypothetical protein
VEKILLQALENLPHHNHGLLILNSGLLILNMGLAKKAINNGIV